jgi:MOSC domain-containing protein YiiM
LSGAARIQVVSVNVGLPREVVSDGKIVLTSIFKTPVQGRVAIEGNNLAGDRQSDLTVHGGPSKAVYAYPSEHYAFWREQLRDVELPWGSFGENLTLAGVLEDAVHVGDRLRVGTAELVVTQPRMPCFKLGIRFDRADMVKRFLQSRRSGFYLTVAVEGELGAGDAIDIVERHPSAVSIREILGMYVREEVNGERVRAAIELPSLSNGWRRELRDRLGGKS